MGEGQAVGVRPAPLPRRHRARPQGVWSHWWASVYHDTTSRLKDIQAPTLVMHGERDAMAPIANARLLAREIPGAELCIVPGSGHAYLLELPIGAARAGASLAGMTLDKLRRRDRRVAPDR